ncbi:hypothetical protein H4R99_006165 [Coemansia sp. RSA 1722]|nr:hypothetical protein LPJ57_004270 [Coemansia sp. RSA 486]KAJ2593215.1 hypothetical protein H4R99_006165 [Coemansia sp. RSA 1722]
MTSVFGKLQALVGSVVSPSTQPPSPRNHTLSSSPTPDAATAAADQTDKVAEAAVSTVVVSEAAELPSDTSGRQRHMFGRPRRLTDATVSSGPTPINTSDDSSASPVRPQDVDKLLPHRLADLERLSRLHPVSKVLQQDSWDCGLACVCMVLRAFGHATCSIARLARQAQTDSVWTIDLAYLLYRNVRADFTFYTQCAGINPEYAAQAFYEQGLDDDEKRVRGLFARARVDQSIRIIEIVIPLIDLKRFLVHRQYVAVLLVDNAVLRCLACERARAASAAQARRTAAHARSRSVNVFRSAASAGSARGVLSWFSRRRPGGDGYLGHYVLLIAYIPSLDVFLYRDPGIAEEFCIAAAATIHAARTRPGTDADCIIVKL